MRKILLLVIFIAGLISKTNAEPAYPFPSKVIQPDGTSITLILKGDERVSWAETLDGYTLLNNSKNGWEYATLDENGNLVSSGIMAHETSKQANTEQKRIKQFKKKLRFTDNQIKQLNSDYSTHTGADMLTGTSAFIKKATSSSNDGRRKLFSPQSTKKLLMLLVQFSDMDLRYGQADFTNLMNTAGYNANGAQGSVRDYFLETSYKQFDITTDVKGPYRMPNTHDYYGADGATKDLNYAEMVTEAVRQADAEGVNFKDYDSDNDGVVDGVYVIFAGWSQAHSGIANDLWSKAGSINYTATNTASGSTKIKSFSISNELLWESSDHLGLATIGVICHEFGHVCGAPDYYDTNYETDGQYQGTGDWDVMCGGNNNGTTSVLSGNMPAHFNPYTKMMFGWLTPVELNAPSVGSYTLQDITTYPHVYKMNTQTPGEYFLLENRQQTGFNATVPGHGLMIYHKDTRPYMRSQAGNNNTHPLSFYPKCANSTVALPTADPASYGVVDAASCPFPGTLGKRSFRDADTPSAQSWAGVNTGLPITNITENADHTVSFNFLSCINVTSLVDFGKLPPNTTSPEQSFTVSGSNLPSDIVITPPVGFEVSLTSGTGFVGNPATVTLAQSGGAVAATTVYVRFHPTAYQSYSSNINLVSGAITQIVPVVGQGNGVYWTGIANTDWNLASNWATGSVPTAVSDVIIPTSGITNWPLISTANASCQDITLQSGAQLTMSGTAAYSLSVSGNWTNNGSFTAGVGTVDFNGTNDLQTISGTSTSTFNILKVDKGAQSRILEATSLIALSGAANPLVITSGTFKLSSASTIKPFTTSVTIGANAGFWNNGGTVNAGAFGWTLSTGLLRVSAGTVNVGTSSGNSITYLNSGSIVVEGGALNVAGRISPNSGTSTGSYTQSGGIVTVNTLGSASTTRAPFELNTVVPFTMSAGSIVVQGKSSNTAADVILLSTTYDITGGTLQIGNSSTTGSPIIRINSTVPVYNLTLNASGTPTTKLFADLTVKGDVTIGSGTKIDANSLNLSVGGNWANNGGNLTPTPTGTVTFNGTTAQSIGGSAGTTFNHLGIDNTTGVTANSTLTTVGGNLVINSDKLLNIAPAKALTVNGTFTNNAGNNGFVLQSDATGTATFLDTGTANTAVAATVQQYLPSVRDWYMSSPVTGATAPAGNTYYKYVENANNGATWSPISSGSTFDVMTGYTVKPSGATTFAFSGALNTGAQSISSLTSTATAKTGYNLVGNPYPSYVHWMSATKTNLSTTIWYRTQNSAITPAYVFDTYNETANTGTNNNGVAAVTGMIPPMQAFWVKVNAGAAGTLAFDNSIRSHQDVSTNQFRAPAANATQQTLRLQVSNGTNIDEAIVLFNANAADGYDAYDSPKMTNANASIPEIYTFYGTEKAVINGLNSIATNSLVSLGFSTGVANTFSIKATEVTNFDTDTRIVLKDKVLNVEQDITDGTPYNFTSDVTSTNNRFSVVFKSKSSTTGIDNSVEKETIIVSKNANNQIVVTNNANAQTGVVTVSNAIGQKLYSTAITGVTTVVTKFFSPGVYLVTVNEGEKHVTKKVIIN